MSKKINAAKLAEMGMDRIRRVCLRHAVRSIEYRDRGNTRMFVAHCSLLDQCAAVGRKLSGKGGAKRTAQTIVESV